MSFFAEHTLTDVAVLETAPEPQWELFRTSAQVRIVASDSLPLALPGAVGTKKNYNVGATIGMGTTDEAVCKAIAAAYRIGLDEVLDETYGEARQELRDTPEYLALAQARQTTGLARMQLGIAQGAYAKAHAAEIKDVIQHRKKVDQARDEVSRIEAWLNELRTEQDTAEAAAKRKLQELLVAAQQASQADARREHNKILAEMAEAIRPLLAPAEVQRRLATISMQDIAKQFGSLPQEEPSNE